jgi:hypothetical protein
VDERHRAVLEEGRTLVKHGETRVTIVDPFLLAARSTGHDLELAIRRVTTFAFVLSAIVGTLIVTRLVPWMLGIIVGSWLIASVIARVFSARRRHEHGEVLVDFEQGRVFAVTLAGGSFDLPLSEVWVRTDRSADEQAPIWLLLVAGRRVLRLGRATEEDAERTLAVFRRYHVRVERRDMQI